MDCLKKNAAEIATGDPQFCKDCNAVFNQASTLKTEPQMGADPKKTWTCEFCNSKNDVLLDDEEIPKAMEVNYLMQAPAQVIDKKLGSSLSEDISVIFCIDTSGSMCVS